LNINFTPQALSDLQAIKSYIAEFNQSTANDVISRVLQVTRMFEQFPLLGREGKISDTREFSIPGLPYIVVYKIASETDIDILTVIHERKQYP